MTATYAHLHDTTVRDAFERWCASRVNVAGELLAFDPGAPTAEAEWIKHRLARIADSLPNGYCGRPPQQACPHPKHLRNAKLVFRTSRVIDARGAGIYRPPGPAPGHGGRPPKRRPSV